MIPVIYFSVGRVITYLGHTRGGGYSFFCRKLEEGIKKFTWDCTSLPPPPPPPPAPTTTIINDRSLNRQVFNGKFFFYNKKAEI